MNNNQIKFFEFVRMYLTQYLPTLRKLSPHTIRSYRNALMLLINFFETDKGINIKEMSLELITTDSMNEFIIWLTDKGVLASTINQRMAAIKAFLSFVALKDPIYCGLNEKVKKINKLKAEDKVIRYLSSEQIAELLSLQFEGTKGERDRILLLLLYETACRESEIAAIKYNDFVLRDNSVALSVIGKGKKQRYIPVTDEIYEQVMTYRRLQNNINSDYVFASPAKATNTHISASSVYKIVASYGRSLKTPIELHPHTLRHTRAMHWYQEGVSLEIISLLLGHSHLETTRIYARADIEMKRKALEKVKATPCSSNNHELFDWEDRNLLLRLSGLT